MTTLVRFSNGEETTYDEGVNAFPSTGIPGVTVVHTEWLRENGTIVETPEQKRDRLRSELAALDDAEGGTEIPDEPAA